MALKVLAFLLLLVSSAHAQPEDPRIRIQGAGGIVFGLDASSTNFTSDGALIIADDQSIVLSGDASFLTVPSSITGSQFFGSGATLTDLPGSSRFGIFSVSDIIGIFCDDTNYKVTGRFTYPGSDEVGAPIAITALAAAESTKDFQVRIFDLGNATTIAESAVFTNTAPETVSLGTLSNIPTGETEFEVQCRSPGGGKGFMDSITLQY